MLDETIKVLLIDDDEDDYHITRSLFARAEGMKYVSDWVNTFEAGLAALLE